MNLKELRAKGAFVSDAPVKKTVTWKLESGDVTFDVFVKRLPFGDYERLYLVDGEDKRSKAARLLCETIRFGDNGDEPMSYKDAYALETTFATVLIDAVNEVNRPKT